MHCLPQRGTWWSLEPGWGVPAQAWGCRWVSGPEAGFVQLELLVAISSASVLSRTSYTAGRVLWSRLGLPESSCVFKEPRMLRHGRGQGQIQVWRRGPWREARAWQRLRAGCGAAGRGLREGLQEARCARGGAGRTRDPTRAACPGPPEGQSGELGVPATVHSMKARAGQEDSGGRWGGGGCESRWCRDTGGTQCGVSAGICL